MKGQHLGAWELVDRLDEGPYGVTWSAVDANGRHARLLMLPAGASGELMFDRLRRGASRAAAVEHDAFVPVTEVAQTADGRLWLTMDSAAGPSLDRLVRSRALQLDDAIGLLHQLLGALSAAHQQGLVHRMLSLACLELNEQGPKQLRIRDLWLANALTPELHLTLTGSANIGVPGFAAPEQVEGQPVDARSDLFSVGCIAFELLTGRPAVPGSSAAERLVNVLRGGVARVSRLRPEVPSWLDELVAQLLASNPSSRPATAAEAIFVIEGRRSEPKPVGQPVEFANQRVELPRVETRVPDDVFGAVQPSANLAPVNRLPPLSRVWWWVLALVMATAIALSALVAIRRNAGPGPELPPIEREDPRGTVRLDCLGCSESTMVFVNGPELIPVLMPATVRLPAGSYTVQLEDEPTMDLEIDLAERQQIWAEYRWVERRWVIKP